MFASDAMKVASGPTSATAPFGIHALVCINTIRISTYMHECVQCRSIASKKEPNMTIDRHHCTS